MDGKDSILEKIIISQQTTGIEQFDPVEVVNRLFKPLLSREEDVLRRRFGLSGKDDETLENIGKTYSVTRERIRQIEKTAITKIKRAKSFSEIINPVEQTITNILEQHGRIMAEQLLLDKLLEVSGPNEVNRKNALFLLSELLKSTYKRIKSSKDYKQSWQLPSAPSHLFQLVVQSMIGIIEKYKAPMTIDELQKNFREQLVYSEHKDLLSNEVIISYLEMSQRISKNPYGEYGLVEWGSIRPKRMNDKIYLILKKSGKPMHFTEIAKKINEIQFDRRKAHPPTVHNELILNDQYVLVGRGMYALREWGYEPGIVADVIEKILKEVAHPLSREELVKRVLDKRIVKRNTILLALTNKNKFTKLPNGEYALKVDNIP